ncbi:MAG: hypothetical protein LBC82_05870 [Oscillospiraceae bacterium]|jgi:guanylate kinase|nr:hypothetical protein [Oscillospiraceae bacterium]
MIIGIVGVSAAGKTFLKRHALEAIADIYPICQVTLRPKKPNEINGLDRHCISLVEFNDMVRKNELISIQDIYGIKYAFRKCDIKSDKVFLTEMWYKDIKELSQITNVKSIYLYSNDLIKNHANLKERYSDENMFQKRIDEDIILKSKLEKMMCDGDFDYTFENKYDPHSVAGFIALIRTIIDKVKEIYL